MIMYVRIQKSIPFTLLNISHYFTFYLIKIENHQFSQQSEVDNIRLHICIRQRKREASTHIHG